MANQIRARQCAATYPLPVEHLHSCESLPFKFHLKTRALPSCANGTQDLHSERCRQSRHDVRLAADQRAQAQSRTLTSAGSSKNTKEIASTRAPASITPRKSQGSMTRKAQPSSWHQQTPAPESTTTLFSTRAWLVLGAASDIAFVAATDLVCLCGCAGCAV